MVLRSFVVFVLRTLLVLTFGSLAMEVVLVI